MARCSDPEVGELVKKYQEVSGQQLREECSHVVHLALDKKLTKWRNVAPCMFTDEQALKSALDAIEHDEHLDEEGKRHELLVRWKETYGSDATHEKLIRAFLSAGRKDLAECVCQTLKKLAAAAKEDHPDSPPPMDPAIHPFPTPVEEDKTHANNSTRNFPQSGGVPVAVGTGLAADPHSLRRRGRLPPGDDILESVSDQNIPLNPRFEESSDSQGAPSHLVSGSAGFKPQTSPGTGAVDVGTNTSHFYDKFFKLNMPLFREIDATFSLQGEKIKELDQMTEKAQGYLKEKQSLITKMEAEVDEKENELKNQQQLLQKYQTDLEQKEDNIQHLEAEIQQKESDKLEHSEELSRVRQSLQTETEAKEEATCRLKEATSRIETLESGIKAVRNEATMLRERKETIKELLRWTNDTFTEVVKAHKNSLKMYKRVIVFQLLIFIVMLLCYYWHQT